MIPSTMRAVVLVDVGKLELRELPVPRVEPGTVLLRVVRASVCNGSDAAIFSGRRKIAIAYPWMKLPFPIGHECAGEVVAVGPGVQGVQVGQRVASLEYGGAFADYQLVHVERSGLIPIPDWLSYDEATFLEPMYATNCYMPHIDAGDRLVLMGLGPSGILLLQQSLARGAACVVCADRHDLRLGIAEELGATATINVEREDIQTAVRNILGEADGFIDATGWDVYDVGMRLLRVGGKIIAYGVPDSGVHYDGTLAYFRDIRILTKVYDRAATIARMQQLLDTRRMDFTTFVTHHFPLEEAPEAIRMALEKPDQCLAMVIDVAD